MKILELRFKNLNSLYGEWGINFTGPEYVSNNIFALTGPTGAGKSTILDAICLALYGATPRLGRITKSGNEIMSRQTGECYAEVVFESRSGRFRCHWGQHRARKKADGNLIDARHEISEAHTGKLIETQKSLVSNVVEEKTGMDFERFTRSMLLAQGGFDAFLKADTEQKSKILEQITGTGIYSEISRRIHERRRKESEELEKLQTKASFITVLEPEREQELRQERINNQEQEIKLAAKIAETDEAIAWLTGIGELKREIDSLSEKSQKLQSEIESFEPDRMRLDRALKATELDGAYATLIAVRKQQKEDRSTLKAEEEKIPDLVSSADRKEEILKKAEKRTLEAKKELKGTAPLIREVRALDQSLADKKRIVKNGDDDCKNDKKQIETDEKRRIQEEKKRDMVQKELKHVQKYLKTNSRDEWLVSGLAGIEEQLRNLHLVQENISDKEKAEAKATESLHTAVKKLKDCEIRQNKREKRAEEVREHLNQEKKELTSILHGRPLEEYHDQKGTLLLKKAFLNKIADLKIERSKLEDGQPCPLCGAKEHPFAEGNIPQADETEREIKSLTQLIEKAREQESVIKRREAIEKDALQKLADSERVKMVAASEKEAAEKNRMHIRTILDELRSHYGKQKETISQILDRQGFALDAKHPELIIDHLKSKMSHWQDRKRKKAEMEKQIAELDSELKKRNAVLKTRREALEAKQTALKTIKEEYGARNSERQELFGSKNPDTEEKELHKAVADAELTEKQARTVCDKAGKRLDAAKAGIATLKERIQKREFELKDAETAFGSHLQSAGFADEEQFRKAHLEAPERKKLQTKAKELDDRKTVLLDKQKDRNSRLSTEIAKKITESKLDALKPKQQECEEERKQLRTKIIELQHRLNENAEAKAKRAKKQSEMEAQKSACHRWEKLHALIGSADGKKYRNFAQGLTFERMVSHANRQLEKMTDRYLLIRDNEQPLALNVVDNYQAGEIRSTKNLSGGESFIMSLALALGLSKMVSRKVTVDSLFLDEGFGTLDEEALETALETLSGLQQDGKLIGIISHISALKERISTQIDITPISGGKSTLSGPGCSKM